MAEGQELSPHIPYLRRFARALAGSQSAGDCCVLATLESIIANPDLMRMGPTMRASLYRAFLSAWEKHPTGETGAPSAQTPDERGARERLEAIATQPRIAFLLSALEGFEVADIAAIVGKPRSETEALLEQAGREIANQLRTDVLIIEDEPFIALELKSLLEDLGHKVTGIARTHREAVQSVEVRRPGLILADIQLADGSSGLEAVNEILLSIETPVIFVTAFPERFLTGRAPEPAFLITKPFGIESLKAVVSQALFFDRRSRQQGAGRTGATI